MFEGAIRMILLKINSECCKKILQLSLLLLFRLSKVCFRCDNENSKTTKHLYARDSRTTHL